MKNHFPEGYCPQREKVLDLSRSVLTGNRRYARHRRNHGRYVEKVNRQISRDQLRRAASWLCACDGDVTVDCPRCYNDDMPTISETCTGSRPPFKLGAWDLYEGFADDLAQLFRGCVRCCFLLLLVIRSRPVMRSTTYLMESPLIAPTTTIRSGISAPSRLNACVLSTRNFRWQHEL